MTYIKKYILYDVILYTNINIIETSYMKLYLPLQFWWFVIFSIQFYSISLKKMLINFTYHKWIAAGCPKNSTLEIGHNWLNCKCKLLEVEITYVSQGLLVVSCIFKIRIKFTFDFSSPVFTFLSYLIAFKIQCVYIVCKGVLLLFV